MEDRKQYISDIPRQCRGGGKCSGVTLTSKWCWQPSLNLTHPQHQGRTGSKGGSTKLFKQHFAPVMLELIRTAAAGSTLPEEWIRGMTKCILKEARIPASDSLRPITLLNCKMTWLTGVLKLCLEDLVQFIVPSEQKGFMKRRCMEDHLHAVHSLWRGLEEGAWLGIDFSKAFDSTSHCLMSAFLIEIGMPPVWVHILEQFLRGPIQNLVGNQITGAELVPGSGIKQGHTVSPTLFSLLTTLLVHKIKLRFPEMRSFLYADGTLRFIPGSLPTVQQGVQGLRELLTHYGDISGYKLNMRNCGVVLQGD